MPLGTRVQAQEAAGRACSELVMAGCTDLDKPFLRPGWPAEVASGLGLRRLGHEVPEPDQVVGSGGQIGPELVALDPDVTQLATPADHLQPAEDPPPAYEYVGWWRSRDE